MGYKEFNVWVEFDGCIKFFEIIALSLESAMADIESAFSGPIALYNFSIND